MVAILRALITCILLPLGPGACRARLPPATEAASCRLCIVLSVQRWSHDFNRAYELLRDAGLEIGLVSTLGGGYAQVRSDEYERAMALLERDPSLAHVVHPREFRDRHDFANPPPEAETRK